MAKKAKAKKRKYSKSSGSDVKGEMRRYKKGKAKSGHGGKGGKVKSPKKAIAIGLSKARKKGKKVPKKEIFISSDMTDRLTRIGTAGWSISAQDRTRFAGSESHLYRYGSVLDCVEINSSFYRPHRRTTYERWASSVPQDFRFSVKIPRAVSHAGDLSYSKVDLDRFLGEVSGLDRKLGVLLVQLPPSSAFSKRHAARLITALQKRALAPLAFEPRHASWFTPDVSKWLAGRKVARVAADPSRSEEAGEPGGWTGFSYFRLHGSPRTYYSSYDDHYLHNLTLKLRAHATHGPVWCIFDNTASGAALGNALTIISTVCI